MAVLLNLLLWLHAAALAIGVGGGLAASQIGPRLVAAAPDQRAAWRPLARSFSRSAGLGLGLLVLTGAWLFWLRSAAGDAPVRGVKGEPALVAAMAAALGLGEWGLARLDRGDEGGARLLRVSAPLTLLAVLALALAAAAAFD